MSVVCVFHFGGTVKISQPVIAMCITPCDPVCETLTKLTNKILSTGDVITVFCHSYSVVSL